MVNKSKFVFNEEDNIPPPKASSKVAAQSRLCRKYNGQLTYDSSKSDSNIAQDSLNYKNSISHKPFQANPLAAEVPLKTSHEQRYFKKEDLGDPVLDDVVAKLKNVALGNNKQVNCIDFKEEKIPSSRVYSNELDDVVAKLKREALMLNQASERPNDVLSVEKSHPGNVNSKYKVDCYPCVCDGPLKLLLCSDCGITFPGRIRKSCPMHKSAVFLLDVEDCKGCNKKSLREYDLPRGMELEVKNVKIKI